MTDLTFGDQSGILSLAVGDSPSRRGSDRPPGIEGSGTSVSEPRLEEVGPSPDTLIAGGFFVDDATVWNKTESIATAIIRDLFLDVAAGDITKGRAWGRYENLAIFLQQIAKKKHRFLIAKAFEATRPNIMLNNEAPSQE